MLSLTSPHSRVRLFVATLFAVLLTLGAVLVASPASAHDELLGTEPVADSAVEVLPEQLTLTFSGVLSTDTGATEVMVTNAAGDALADGEPVVQDTTVTQALTGTASGAVTVLWKVVSSDGHPISGEYSFEVTAAPEPTPTATATAPATATPSEPPVETATPTTTAAPVPEESGSNASLPWLIGGLIAAAVVAAVVYLLVSRARRKRAEEAISQSRADAVSGPTPPTTER